jgi:uncharacterized protein
MEDGNMIGTIVNFAAIIAGGFLGLILKGGLPKKVSDTLMQGLALCIIYIGISGSLKGQNMILIITSIALGSIIGEIIDLDNMLRKFGDNIEKRFKNGTSKISEGFVSASLLYCVGAMAIVGSLESGLQGNYETLFAKSILDGISSIVFASTLGIGVILSSFSVLLYQGAITLCASLIKDLLNPMVINDMTASGSLLITGLGLNMLGITKIKVANLLPAVIIQIFLTSFFGV